MALLGLDGRFLKMNRELGRILGYSEGELLGGTFQALTHPEDQTIDADQAQALASGDITHYHAEKRCIHKSGRSVWVSLSVALVHGPDGEPRMLVAEVQDTTEQKGNEAQLLSSVVEKEVLLKEIHHRVKNNLQVISSILRLQGKHSSSPEVRGMFQDSQARIQTMALIHEELYRSKNLASIDFAVHLQDLSTMLGRLFATPGCSIRMELAVESMILNLDTAVPLGLVANELITNALKHAFTGRRAGMISIALQLRDSSFTLTVADDGVGFPADFDLDSSGSLGLHMIRVLARQLRAKITVEREGRNAISLTGPIAPGG
jgi:PAS domain S-box-containing protein